MKLTEIERKTTAIEDVRQLCIRKNWYTQGTNKEYEKLFTLVKNGAGIMDIADNIYRHSSLETCPNIGAAYGEIEVLAVKWKMQLSPDEE